MNLIIWFLPHSFGDNLNAEMRVLEDSKKVSVVKKIVVFFQTRNMILKNPQDFARERGESASSKQRLRREVVRTICDYQVELTDKPDQAFVPAI